MASLERSSAAAAATAALAASPHPLPWHRPSLLGTDERIVIDLGSRICRAGFSGDAEPRVMLDALAFCARIWGEPKADALWLSLIHI